MLSPIFDLPAEMNLAITERLDDQGLSSFSQVNHQTCALAREVAFKKIAACYPELVEKHNLTAAHPKVIALLKKENQASAEACFRAFSKAVPGVGVRYVYAGVEYELGAFLKKCAKSARPESKQI